LGGETKQLGELGTNMPVSESFDDRQTGRLEEGHGHRWLLDEKKVQHCKTKFLYINLLLSSSENH
jgi:hypothetical protein